MKLTNIVFCLLSGALFASCINEDMDDCPTTNRLVLSYKGDGSAEIFPDKICRVEMFVFDAENRCVSSTTLPEAQVRSRTAYLPTLQAGDYRIVCVGNAHHTQFDGTDSGDYSRMIFADSEYFAGTQETGNDSLYYASTDYTIKPYSEKGDNEQTRVIEFAASHYDLLVEVAGVPDGGTRPGLWICGVTPCTDFENSVCGEPTDYLLETEYEPAEETMTARTNIMRHKNHGDVFIRVGSSDGGAALAEVNLADFLAAHPSIDCSLNEVLIPVRIEFKQGQVTVSVPEWYIENVKPEF